MADYQIMYWKDIPYAVRAFEDQKRVSKQLPSDFEKAIDAASMAANLTTQKEYQAGFVWGERETRAGSAEEVAQAIYDELVAAYPLPRLMDIARGYKGDK